MSTTETRAEQIQALAEHFRAFENWHCIEGAHRERAEMLLDGPIRDIERAAAAKALREATRALFYDGSHAPEDAAALLAWADRIEGGQ